MKDFKTLEQRISESVLSNLDKTVCMKNVIFYSNYKGGDGIVLFNNDYKDEIIPYLEGKRVVTYRKDGKDQVTVIEVDRNLWVGFCDKKDTTMELVDKYHHFMIYGKVE